MQSFRNFRNTRDDSLQRQHAEWAARVKRASGYALLIAKDWVRDIEAEIERRRKLKEGKS